MRPEDYWIARGEDVIGLDVLTDGESARQAATYQAIVDVVIRRQIKSVLDIGCNVTALKMFLDRYDFQGFYIGVDTNINALSRTGMLLAAEGDLRQLGFLNEMFQCSIVKDVIEHLESPEPLREAFRVASEYTIIATYLPWHDAPSEIVQHPDGYYTNTYNRQEIIDLARECGFELVETIATQETNGTPNEVTVWERA